MFQPSAPTFWGKEEKSYHLGLFHTVSALLGTVWLAVLATSSGVQACREAIEIVHSHSLAVSPDLLVRSSMLTFYTDCVPR